MHGQGRVRGVHPLCGVIRCLFCNMVWLLFPFVCYICECGLSVAGTPIRCHRQAMRGLWVVPLVDTAVHCSQHCVHVHNNRLDGPHCREVCCSMSCQLRHTLIQGQDKVPTIIQHP